MTAASASMGPTVRSVCRRRRTLFPAVLVMMLLAAMPPAAYSSSSPPASPMVIRVRTADGSVLRVAAGDGGETTLSRILAAAGVEAGNLSDGTRVKISGGGSTTLDPAGDDAGKTASELGLRHGSMLTLILPQSPSPSSERGGGGLKKKKATAGATKPSTIDDRFNPFPDLAKATSYADAQRRSRAMSRGSRGGRMSYGDISRLRSMMHNVEPQPEGPIKRVYMCRIGAERFQSHCIVNPPKKKKKKASSTNKPTEPRIENRVAALFGTVNKERVDRKKNVARTSLSTPRADQKMCQVVKVHAVWEPPNQSPRPVASSSDEGGAYDASGLLDTKRDAAKALKRALRVASSLGLRPVGWMFSYAEDRHEDGDALPVHASDVLTGASLQIDAMKRDGRDDGRRFVTLALDARSGATEAFQLSDVAVQMVAEGVLKPLSDSKRGETKEKKKKKNTGKVEGNSSSGRGGVGSVGSGRFLTALDTILVDGKETTELDSVLCLVNTAMLSHAGSLAGEGGGSAVKRGTGALTAKAKKALLAALEAAGGSSPDCDAKVLELLCDFDVLMAIDAMIGKGEMDQLCELVRKWSCGQRRGAMLGESLRLVLQSVLGG